MHVVGLNLLLLHIIIHIRRIGSGWVAKESENIINYKKENPIKAFELLIKPAYNGNRIAQSYLGRLLLKEYVEAPYLHSFQDALYWLKKAAEQEDPIAQYYLGTCYEELDKKEAVYDDDGSYYLKYFEGFPMDRNARTKILNEDTGEIYYGYKAACEALGIKYDGSSNIRTAIYKKNNSGTDKTAYGYHFDEIY